MSGRKFRENAPNATGSLSGVSTPHMPLQKRTQRLTCGHRRGLRALVGNVPLHHDFFNALLLSCQICGLKLFLIELLDD